MPRTYTKGMKPRPGTMACQPCEAPGCERTTSSTWLSGGRCCTRDACKRHFKVGPHSEKAQAQKMSIDENLSRCNYTEVRADPEAKRLRLCCSSAASVAPGTIVEAPSHDANDAEQRAVAAEQRAHAAEADAAHVRQQLECALRTIILHMLDDQRRVCASRVVQRTGLSLQQLRVYISAMCVREVRDCKNEYWFEHVSGRL
jgi:hypothetical protein